MALTHLPQHRVAKPWGRRNLPHPFAPVAPTDDPVGEVHFDAPGPPPPLLIKYLFTSAKLSVQVHPDDAAARHRGLPRGKDEAWYILDADEGAVIGVGLTRHLSPDALRAAALDGSIERLLDWRPVAAGQTLFAPAGTIHAIGAGISLIEIQQNLDVTYRLFDYGSDRSLHLDEAIDVADRGPLLPQLGEQALGRNRDLLCDTPAFRIERWTGPMTGDVESGWLIPLDGGLRVDDAPLARGEVGMVTGTSHLDLADDARLLIATATASEEHTGYSRW